MPKPLDVSQRYTESEESGQQALVFLYGCMEGESNKDSDENDDDYDDDDDDDLCNMLNYV